MIDRNDCLALAREHSETLYRNLLEQLTVADDNANTRATEITRLNRQIGKQENALVAIVELDKAADLEEAQQLAATALQ